MDSQELKKIAKEITRQGGKCFIVGGFVRDLAMGKESKDIDVEVFGIDPKRLTQILRRFGKVSTVGKSFGVIKLTTKENDFDFSLPRRENKVGQGHKGFMVEFDETITPKEAARRRDFTFNAMSLDPETGKVIDFFGGMDDIEKRIIRATSEMFVQDPLRVLRGFQFAARFEMTVDAETAKMCQELKSEFHTLPKERIWEEWKKWAEKSTKPSMGLRFLVDTGWIEFFPEIEKMIGLAQDETWHPEGNVFEHTCQSVDLASGTVMRFAALCHDMGKVNTTQVIDGKITSHGHDKAGEEMAQTFMARIGAPKDLTEKVVALTGNHMFLGQVSQKTVRRLAHRVQPATIEELTELMAIDKSARGQGHMVVHPIAEKIREIAKVLHVESESPQPIIMGRHLIEMGMTPGPRFGEILEMAFQAQLDGMFDSVESGMEFVETIVE